MREELREESIPCGGKLFQSENAKIMGIVYLIISVKKV